MSSLRHGRRHFLLIVAVLGLIASGSRVVHADMVQVASIDSPRLVQAAGKSPGSALVRGEGFTPGGQVFIAVYDTWGEQVHEGRWVYATSTVYGPNVSQDPAVGFHSGGAIAEVFGVSETVYGPSGSQDPAVGFVRGDEGFDGISGALCGATLMVRAYDAQASIWSNVLDVEPGC